MSQAGEWLADGWGACVWAVIADHDHKRDVLQLANVNSGKPCSHCPADRKNCPWWDFSLDAKWSKETYTKACDLASPILRMVIGVSILSVFPDWMHDKYLGTDKVYYVRVQRSLSVLRVVLALTSHIGLKKSVGG